MPLILETWRYAPVNKVITFSAYGLVRARRHAITWTSDHLLLIEPTGTNSNWFWIKIQKWSCMKIHLKMSFGKCQLFCSGLNVYKIETPFSGRLILPTLGRVICSRETFDDHLSVCQSPEKSHSSIKDNRVGARLMPSDCTSVYDKSGAMGCLFFYSTHVGIVSRWGLKMNFVDDTFKCIVFIFIIKILSYLVLVS